jgi:hypothetical protein
MLSIKEIASRIALNKTNAIPSGVIKTNISEDYLSFLNTSAFKGFEVIARSYPTELLTTNSLHELILAPQDQGVKALIYGVQAPFFCEDMSHTIITNDLHVVAHCAKTKGYEFDTDFKSGFLSFLNGYTACIF